MLHNTSFAIRPVAPAASMLPTMSHLTVLNCVQPLPSVAVSFCCFQPSRGQIDKVLSPVSSPSFPFFFFCSSSLFALFATSAYFWLAVVAVVAVVAVDADVGVVGNLFFVFRCFSARRTM
eukprot:NODE_7241_length_493_cov_18.666667_g6800_i0.p1 GENE.NODE_7241_length_493_cov_18.666667_g6800_i0~~NODE_7241_length_493_cov_18.666667_g6800_i0.p1  ORF type:complete len:120 (+),score=8.06 NODE_7241_length_493_cov_18.666667_g6800_i0:129-488(+)